jgi:hypothetical protein
MKTTVVTILIGFVFVFVGLLVINNFDWRLALAATVIGMFGIAVLFVSTYGGPGPVS